MFSSQGVLSQSVQGGFTTLKKHNISSIAHKGGSRGVIEDTTPFLEKRDRGFLFWELVSWGDGKKQDLTPNFGTPNFAFTEQGEEK